MNQKPDHLAVDDPANARLLQRLASWRPRIAPISHPKVVKHDLYRDYGSHPDIVTRVWDEIGAALPVNCRCLVYGSPALVAPTSGAVLAVTWGTSYIIRVPLAGVPEMCLANGRLIRYLTKAAGYDVNIEFGDGWMWGCFLKEELQWSRTVYTDAESGSKD